MSILSYPERGPWGSASWRGNMSGHVYQDLFKRLQPRLFVDPMMGSGSSIEAALAMGIDAIGLDLHSGFNILRDSILATVGKHADFVCSHPPYGGQIKYSGPGGMWGDVPHPDDLSHCIDDADFHEKMQIALLNQREATRPGGHYAVIIGDWRRDGKYTSYQAECIARMPSDELASVVIKQQHNTASSRKTYGAMKYPLITHEYIIVWCRKQKSTFLLLATLAREQSQRLRGTWRAIIRNVVMTLGGKADLKTIYAAVANGCPERLKANPSWKDKVRQVLNSSGEYVSEARGIWALA